jgi:hypothetical protein
MSNLGPAASGISMVANARDFIAVFLIVTYAFPPKRCPDVPALVLSYNPSVL